MGVTSHHGGGVASHRGNDSLVELQHKKRSNSGEVQKGGYLRQKLDQGQMMRVTVMEGEGEGDTKAVFLEP